MAGPYYTADYPEGISVEALAEMSPEEQREVMEDWFYRHYEDPAENTPYESAEGGYMYIWGGPYEARDVLWEEFEGTVSEEVIEALVVKLDRKCPEWAPVQTGDFEDHDDEPAGNEPPKGNEEPGLVDQEGAARARVSHFVDIVLEVLKRVEPIPPKHGEIGHNQPQEEFDKTLPLSRSDFLLIRSALANIKQQVTKPSPDPVVVEASSKILETTEAKVSTWVAESKEPAVNKFKDSFSTEMGKSLAQWFSPIGVASAITTVTVIYAALQGLLSHLIESLHTWLPFIHL